MNFTHTLFKATFLSLLGFGFYSCSGADEPTQDNRNTVIPAVEAVQARYGSLPLVERFSGNVRSENQVALFPEITANVEQVFVENGESVEKGQKLVQLASTQLEQQLQQAKAGARINAAQVKQAKSRLTELESEYRRTKQLAERELTSQLALEQIEAQMASAEADVELAEARLDQSESLVAQSENQLSKTIVRAPISGTVGQRNAQPGMQASPNTQLFLIGDLSRLRVEIVLTEAMLSRISVGQTARILLEDRNGEAQTIEGKLTRISPFLNPVTRSTEAEIDVENQNNLLRPGMFVPVDVHFGESDQATLIPTSALYTDPSSGEEGVYVATSLGSEIEPTTRTDSNGTTNTPPTTMTEPTQVEFRPINVLARGRMEVGVGGLESGQWVVTVGQDLLAEGRTQARVRTMTWDRIFQLQLLQREDLLREVLQERTNKDSNVTL
ncbi:MAG: efflux RND transporter periplasmic adaptor subunit [Balneolaceae bacterium]